jgi:hypothetical protein
MDVAKVDGQVVRATEAVPCCDRAPATGPTRLGVTTGNETGAPEVSVTAGEMTFALAAGSAATGALIVATRSPGGAAVALTGWTGVEAGAGAAVG